MGILVVCGLCVSHCFGCYIFLVLLPRATYYLLVYFLCLNWVLIGIQGRYTSNFLFPPDMLSINLINLKGFYYSKWAQAFEVFLLIGRSLIS